MMYIYVLYEIVGRNLKNEVRYVTTDPEVAFKWKNRRDRWCFVEVKENLTLDEYERAF